MSENGSGPWLKILGCSCGCIILIIGSCVATGGLGIVGLFTGMKSSQPYVDALEAAQSHPAVIEALGEPIEAGWMLSGNISLNGSSGEADLSFPISGPLGDGTVYVIGDKQAGEWSYSLMEVEIGATGERIDLLGPRPAEQPLDDLAAAGFARAAA